MELMGLTGLIGLVVAIFMFCAQMKLFSIDNKLASLIAEQQRTNWFAEEAMRVSRLDHGIAPPPAANEASK